LCAPDPPARQHGRLRRLDGHERHAGTSGAERLADAAQAPGGADDLDEPVDLAPRLPPDLVGHARVAGELPGIAQLVGPERARAVGDYPGGVNHVARQPLGHPAAVAGHDLQPGTEQAHVVQFLARERVRRDDVQRVALDGAHEGEGHAGAAAGVLDHRRTGRRRVEPSREAAPSACLSGSPAPRRRTQSHAR